MTKPTYLVVGGTGTVGRHVVRQLLGARQDVRVLARDVAKATELLGSDAEIVAGDLSQPETLARAFKGVSKVFILAAPGPDLVAQEGEAFDAAKAAGVSQVVYLSNFGAGTIGPPHSLWGAHGTGESRLRGLGVAWTILRPTRFMTDTPFPWAWDQERGVVAEPLGASKVTMIAPEDIAAVAVKILLTPGHEGQIYELTAADALSGTEIAEALSQATGKSTKFVDVTPAAARESIVAAGTPPFIADIMLEYFAALREGRWYVTSTATDLLGRTPLSFGQWLRGGGGVKG
jgi:uncharacterized protein YbjT (DUF2867 family)